MYNFIKPQDKKLKNSTPSPANKSKVAVVSEKLTKSNSSSRSCNTPLPTISENKSSHSDVSASPKEIIFSPSIDSPWCYHSTSSPDIIILSTQNTNVSHSKPNEINGGHTFSLEEDEQIINFFKNETTFLKVMFQKQIYNIMKKSCSLKRSWEELRSRFLGDILPNLYKYKCLSYGEMIDMYNMINMEIPDELQSTIYNLFSSKNSQACNMKDVCTQKTDDINLYRVGKYVGFKLCNENHLIIPNSDVDSYKQNQELDKYRVQNNNVHIVENEEFTMYCNLERMNAELKVKLTNKMESYIKKIEEATSPNFDSNSFIDKLIEKYQSPVRIDELAESSFEANKSQNKSEDYKNDNMIEKNANTQYFDCNTSNELNICTPNNNTPKLYVKNIAKLTYSKTDPFSSDETQTSNSDKKIELQNGHSKQTLRRSKRKIKGKRKM